MAEDERSRTRASFARSSEKSRCKGYCANSLICVNAGKIGRRLAIGWTMGTLVSALGVYFSVLLDLPTGATIVCTFGLILIVMAAVRPLIRSRAAAAAGRGAICHTPTA